MNNRRIRTDLLEQIHTILKEQTAAVKAEQTARETAETRLTEIRTRLGDIKSNALYTLVPSWLKAILNEILPE